MIQRVRNMPAELVFSLMMLIIMFVLSALFGLPIRVPGAQGAAFVGVHYLFPLAGVLAWGLCASLNGRRDMIPVFIVALPSYIIVLLVHFHLKLWAPQLHPTSYDEQFWRIDQLARPLVNFCEWSRAALLPAIPYEANLYMLGFIGMFYVSFCFFALRRPEAFRRLFIAALFMQGLGGLSYLAMPALGPFLYEPAMSPFARASQHHMLSVHHMIVAGGAPWLSDHGAENLMAGLGAMPSLHTGSSFLFLWFAYRYARVLLAPFSLMFGFIAITAVANRWHYLIDLPAGIVLALVCIHLSGRLTRVGVSEEHVSPTDAPVNAGSAPATI
jgi:hypothetical protein